MNDVLLVLHGVTLTPWKLIGLVGAFLFTARWFVQLYATKKLKRVVMPMAFWYLSIVGSAMTLAYFIWGKNDSVGIILNAFPMFVSVYNVFVHVRHQRSETVNPGGSEES
ncbi:MAG: lipid-A-disaccharide synthase N-terminal domain-containing protein [Dokdonella sp.]